MATTEEQSKLLIVSVDKDDDVGFKTKLRTPFIGREDCLKVATRLAIADPEEADANAIFAAIKHFDDLSSRKYDCEVAVIAGSREGGVIADQKIRSELLKITKKFKATGLVLVSDGYEDREILPILMSVQPVLSIQRIVIKHSGGLEESYAVLGKYMKMLIFDPRYSKFFLGLPGILIIIIGLLSIVGLANLAVQVFIVLSGIFFVITGFGFYRQLGYLKKMKLQSYIKLFSGLTMIMIISAAFYQSFVSISILPQFTEVASDFSLIFKHGAFLFGNFVQEAILLTWIGFGIFMGGSFLVNILRESLKVWRTVLALVVLIFLYIPVWQFSQILINPQLSIVNLVTQLLIGFTATFLVVVVAYQYLRSHKKSIETT